MENKDDRSELMNKIFILLKENDDEWFKSKRLEGLFDVSGSKIRGAIHDIREEAYPIISTSKGYKYATSAEEVNRCLAHMYSRVRSIIRASKGLAKARKRLDGRQMAFSYDRIEELDRSVTEGINELE